MHTYIIYIILVGAYVAAAVERLGLGGHARDDGPGAVGGVHIYIYIYIYIYRVHPNPSPLTLAKPVSIAGTDPYLFRCEWAARGKGGGGGGAGGTLAARRAEGDDVVVLRTHGHRRHLRVKG